MVEHLVTAERNNMKTESPTTPIGLGQAVRQVGFGVLMGGADVVPGVSGGTVALILGIYHRLVTAISHCDRRLWLLVKRQQWHEAMAHLDLPFLLSLGVGILVGVITLGGLMNELLSQPTWRGFALAALFGLICASIVVVGKMVLRSQPTSPPLLMAIGCVGVLFAAWLTQLGSTYTNTSLPYVFGCGAIAICAMILPGISGAYLLLILGLYGHITGILKRLPRGQVQADDLVTLGVFALGCALGLISFSKVLRWLLQHYQGITMALLCGLMVGALPKVWPFQIDKSPEVQKLSHKHFENYWPALSFEVAICVAIAVAFFVGVVFLEAKAARSIGTKKS